MLRWPESLLYVHETRGITQSSGSGSDLPVVNALPVPPIQSRPNDQPKHTYHSFWNTMPAHHSWDDPEEPHVGRNASEPTHGKYKARWRCCRCHALKQALLSASGQAKHDAHF